MNYSHPSPYILVTTIVLTLLGLSACNRHAPERDPTLSQHQAATSLDHSTDSTAQIRTYTGALVLGHEADYFVDCATKATWWVDDSVVPALRTSYRRTASQPYQEVYAMLEGYCTDRPEEGFASQYTQVLHVVRVLELDHLDGGNDCMPQHQ